MSHIIWGKFVGAGIEYIRPYIEVSWEQNLGQNSSTVTATLYFDRYTDNFKSRNEFPAGDSRSHSCTFSVGGNSLTETRPFNMTREAPPNYVEIWTRTRTITHNTNGTASITISASGDTKVDPGTYSFGETVTLPTIPRQTTISEVSMRYNLNPTANNALDISIDRKHSSYTHEFEILAGSTSLHSSTGGAVSAVTIPSEDVRKMIDLMPTVTSREFTFRVSTYNGDVLVGRATKNFEVALHHNSTRPTIPSTWVSRLGSGYDNTILKYVQNISRVRMQFAADYGRGANRQSQTIKINGTDMNGSMLSDNETYRVDTDPLNLSGTVTIEFIATNSRGQESEPVTREIGFYAYTPPSISQFNVQRTNANATNVIVTRRHSFTPLGGDNTVTAKVERRLTSGTGWSEVNDANDAQLSTTITGNNAAVSYVFRTTVTDSFGNSAMSEDSLGTAAVLQELYRDVGISVGQRFDPNNSSVLQVGGDISLLDGQGRTLKLLTPAFINLILQSGWAVDNSSAYGPPGAFKVGGMVYLTGNIRHSGNPIYQGVIATLPEGFRPAYEKYWAIHTTTQEGVIRLLVGRNGDIRLESNVSGEVRFCTLFVISFPVGG